MMKQRLILFTAILGVKLSAAPTSHEILLGWNHGVAAGYNYSATDWLQLGLFPTYQDFSVGDIGLAKISLLAGPTINFGEHYFFNFAAGAQRWWLYSQHYYDTSFAMRAEFGMRFEIIKGVTYRPEFGVLRVSGENNFFVQPLALSVNF